MNIKTQLKSILEYLNTGLIEREVPLKLALLSVLSGEHLLLLGPPGTAKSELARKLRELFVDATYFERLLTRFSVPEEIFGPLSIKALEKDRFQRLTKNYLPEANIAFIDEIFKANSAILNTLLTLLNEREFDNGSERIKTPLLCVLAASNEMPEDESLDALYDRFMFRFQVTGVSDKGFHDLLMLSNSDKEEAPLLSLQVIQSIQNDSSSIPLENKAMDLLHELRGFLKDQSIYVSDRRWRKVVKILQVMAFSNQQKTISEWDCTLLVHFLWYQPEDKALLENWFVNKFNINISETVDRLTKLIIAWESQLLEDQGKYTQKVNEQGYPLFTTPDGKITTQGENVVLAERSGELLYLAPIDESDRSNNGNGYTLNELEKLFFDENYKQTHMDGHWVDLQNYINNTQNRLVKRTSYEPLVEPYLFTSTYKNNQLDELNDVLSDVENTCYIWQSKLDVLSSVVSEHLWMSGDFLSDYLIMIHASYPELTKLNDRVALLIEKNSKLKIEDTASVNKVYEY